MPTDNLRNLYNMPTLENVGPKRLFFSTGFTGLAGTRGPYGMISHMLEWMLYGFLGGFLLFLLGMSIFMYHENRKFEDNQHMVKLLPPPLPARAERKQVNIEEDLVLVSEVIPGRFP